MSKGNEGRKKNPVTVAGPWFAMPLDFLRSRAWAELSPHAAKMLFDLCAGLGANAKGNGDLSGAPTIMAPKGWCSNATRVAALQELESARLISITRRGNRRLCALYAVTLWPLHCDLSKLDHGPGSYTTTDWQTAGADRSKTPTTDSPAKWKPLRKNTIGLPAAEQPPADINPPRDNLPARQCSYVPATGSIGPVSAAKVIPPRDTYLDSPSGAGAGVRVGAGVAGVQAGVAAVGVLCERVAKPARIGARTSAKVLNGNGAPTGVA